MSVKTTLRQDQLEDLQKAISLDGRMCVFNDRRTGKSRLALAITEELNCQRVLLIGQNSFLESWDYELLALAESGNAFGLPLMFLNEGTVLQRGLKLREVMRSGRPTMVAVNIEAFWRKDLRQAIRDWKPDMIIYDEAHKLITRSTRAARFAHQIARQEPWFKHALALTATWQEGGFEDVFSIMKAVNPEVFTTDYQVFKENHCIVATHMCKSCGELVSNIKQASICGDGWHRGYFIPVRGSNQIIGYKDLEGLFEKIKAHSTRRTQAEVNILQPFNKIIPVTLSPSTRKQYDEFMSKYVYQFNNSGKSVDVVARIALSALVKAQEVTSGWVQDERGNVLDISSEKLDLAVQDATADNKAGIQSALYSKFNHDIYRLATAMKIDPKMTYSSLAGDGKKGKDQRKEVLRQLIKGNLGTIIGNGRMIAYGLNLSQCGTAGFFCVTPKTKILTAELEWIEAGDLLLGQKLLAFDDDLASKIKDKHIQHSKTAGAAVTHTGTIKQLAYRIELEDGSIIESSAEHPWLVSNGSKLIQWRTTEYLAKHINTFIRESWSGGRPRVFNMVRFFTPWVENTTKDAGWLAAIFDGEGYISFANNNKNVFRIGVSQNEGLVLNKIEHLLQAFKISYKKYDHSTSNCKHIHLTGNWREGLRFLGEIRPVRLLNKFEMELFQGRMHSRPNETHIRIKRIEPLGLQDVIALSTSTHTYYAEGFGAHNSSDWSSIEFEQLNGRLQAPNKQPIHRHYCATDTVDERIYDALINKTELRLQVFGEQPIPMGGDPDITYNEPTNSWEGF